MLPTINLKFDDASVLQSRMTSRRLFPPRQKKEPVQESKPLLVSDLNPKPPPKPIVVPGVQGIIVHRAVLHNNQTYTSEYNVPAVAIAPDIPFSDNCRRFARYCKAHWNQVFNVWEIPIRADSQYSLLVQIWGWVEEAYYEVDWCDYQINLIWNLGLNEKNRKILANKVVKLNHQGQPDLVKVHPVGVIPHIPEAELMRVACQSFKDINRWSIWQPKPDSNLESIKYLCVNYLRHLVTTGYDRELQSIGNKQASYLDLFEQVNRAIAQAYPWLADQGKRISKPLDKSRFI